MNLIFGYINKKSGPISDKVLGDEMVFSKYSKQGGNEVWNLENILFVSHSIRTISGTHSKHAPFFDYKTKCCIISDLRLDCREELFEALGLSIETDSDICDSQLVLKAYYKWDKDLVNQIYGDFSFAIWDGNKRELFCARDHLGIRPFYYYNDKNLFVFSNDVSSLLKLPGLESRIKHNYIIDSLLGIYPTTHRTAFNLICKLEPASVLFVDHQDKVRKYRYWNLNDKPSLGEVSDEEIAMNFKTLLIESVKTRLSSNSLVSSDLSGGLDSSGITGIAVLLDRKKIIAMTQALDKNSHGKIFPFVDESEYWNEMANFSKIKKHVVLTGEANSSFEALENYLLKFPWPTLCDFAIFSDQLFETASDLGSNVLLSGFGGDEGITYKSSEYLISLIENKKWKSVYQYLKRTSKKSQKISKKGAAIFFILHRLPFIIIIKTVLIHILNYPRFIRKSAILSEKLRFRTILIFRHIRTFNLERQLSRKAKLDLRLRQDSFIDRLESSYLNAHSFGIEYRYPWLDRRLLEFYNVIPPKAKENDEYNRYLYRVSMKDILPDKIRLRQDKMGTTIPNGISRIISEEEKYMELLNFAEKHFKYHYVNYNRIRWIFEEMKIVKPGSVLRGLPHSFIIAVQVLLLQKLQKEGKISIGIKC